MFTDLKTAEMWMKFLKTCVNVMYVCELLLIYVRYLFVKAKMNNSIHLRKHPNWEIWYNFGGTGHQVNENLP